MNRTEQNYIGSWVKVALSNIYSNLHMSEKD